MLQLPEVLTQTTATACMGAQLSALSEVSGKAVVDASRLETFDSVALAFLLELRRSALAQGKTFEVSGIPERLSDLARLYGVAELLVP
jgi:phospholipid transport system transporter-binding protein